MRVHFITKGGSGQILDPDTTPISLNKPPLMYIKTNVSFLFLLSLFHSWGYHSPSWFKVAVSATDSTSTETHRSRRLGSISKDTRKMLHKNLKNF